MEFITDKLNTHILNPIKDIGSSRLIEVFYYDPGGIEFLSDNKAGIQIIGGQIEFQFEHNRRLFISWANVPGWEQYALSCSGTTFFLETSSKWTMGNSKWWKPAIGKNLGYAEILGFEDNEGEPNLASLTWGSSYTTAIANWMFEKDFAPKYPNGDDIWVLFNESDKIRFSEKMKLIEIGSYKP